MVDGAKQIAAVVKRTADKRPGVQLASALLIATCRRGRETGV
jgi:hypothetical protein